MNHICKRPDAGEALPDLALEDCIPMVGDSVEHAVVWKDGSDISRYSGRPVRLRFAMKDSDLFSLRFS